MSYKHIAVEPIASSLGAEVTGVDLSDLPNADTILEIRRAFLEHLLLTFPDQDISPDAFKAFGEKFGTLNVHPFLPNREDLPEIMVLDKTPDRDTNVGNGWHSDMTFLENPPLGSVLHARILPPVGGDTLFRNMYLVYESLSDGMKQLLDGLVAVHDYTIIFQKSARAGRTRMSEAELMTSREKYPLVEHPVVRIHPETGRKLLFVNPFFTSHFKGMTQEESQPILDFLYAFGDKPEFTFRYKWQENAIAFWDNRCAQHYAVNDYQGHRRLMHRLTVNGDRPY